MSCACGRPSVEVYEGSACCGRGSCRGKAAKRARVAELAAEARLLLRYDTARSVAQRLGYKPDTLAVRFKRNGFPELARPFWRVSQWDKRDARGVVHKVAA